MAALAKFRLISGRHYEPVAGFKGAPNSPDSHKLYQAGKPGQDIVEADRDLEAVFQNKFRRLSDEESAPPINMEKRREEVALLIQSGVWQEEDRSFLERLTEDNFHRVATRFKEAVGGNKAGDSKVNSVLGEDVSSEFGRAYDANLKVFRNAKNKYWVTTPKDTGKPLHEDPLAKGDVDKFVETHLKG